MEGAPNVVRLWVRSQTGRAEVRWPAVGAHQHKEASVLLPLGPPASSTLPPLPPSDQCTTWVLQFQAQNTSVWFPPAAASGSAPPPPPFVPTLNKTLGRHCLGRRKKRRKGPLPVHNSGTGVNVGSSSSSSKGEEVHQSVTESVSNKTLSIVAAGRLLEAPVGWQVPKGGIKYKYIAIVLKLLFFRYLNFTWVFLLSDYFFIFFKYVDSMHLYTNICTLVV